MSKVVAERKARTQGITISSGASQLELEATGQHSPNMVCRVSLVLTEQEGIDLRDELDSHIAKLAESRRTVVTEQLRQRQWDEITREAQDRLLAGFRRPAILAAIPDFDAALGECE